MSSETQPKDNHSDVSFVGQRFPSPRQGRLSEKRRFSLKAAKDDLVQNRRIYAMAASAAFGGMFFGWDTGLIGGILSMDSFKHSFGLDNGQSTAALAALNGNIVSVLQAGCFFGALSGGYASEKLGRKQALMVSVVIYTIGSIIQLCSGIHSKSLTPLYVGRVIGGWGVGMNSAIVPAYISESSPRAIRGRMTGMMQLFNVTGIMLSYFVNYGSSLHVKPHLNPAMWRVGFGCQLIPGGLFAMGMLFQKESPRWLCERGRYDEACAVVARLRCQHPKDPVVLEQIDDIRRDFEGKPRPTFPEQFRTMFSGRVIFYRSILGTLLMFAQQWTGTNAINYYAPQIFSNLGISGANTGLLATGIYGVVKVVFTTIALAVAIEQAGRKECLIYGGLGQAFSFFFIAIYQAVHPDSSVIPASFAAIVMVYLYVIFFSFGWGSTAWALAGELPPNSTRALSLSLAVATQWLFNFVIAKITPSLLAEIKYGTFLLFALCLVIMVICVYVALPETSGVALEDIGELFEDPEGIIVRSIRDSPGGDTLLRWFGVRAKSGGSPP
ncbi:general substrate transporter [Gautieria morchelliformis]|nr:general substrate transporter [Gautieria morchelliformis]